jgi:hypothetical protein
MDVSFNENVNEVLLEIDNAFERLHWACKAVLEGHPSRDAVLALIAEVETSITKSVSTIESASSIPEWAKEA